ncbi:MAG TPA: ParB/RepB/Spo0J family partition protein [Firmicutes bacterium]|nr:ParB/RepB/Spo0J family partition protein [Bacillota bacterium]
MKLPDKRRVVELPAEKLIPNPRQPRKTFSKEELDGLSRSIASNGLLQPISVRRTSGGKYEIIAGERRWRACVQAGMRQIPCLVQECSDAQSAVLAILENLQRQDLQVFEEAEGIRRLMEDWGVTQEEAARRLGKSQSAIANKLRLLRLTSEERKCIVENGLSERHARAILRIPQEEARKKLLAQVVEKGLTVRQTEELVEKTLEEKTAKPARGRTFIAKDIRIFLNTIDHAIRTMQDAGILAQADRKDMGDYLEYTVKIPKTGNSSKGRGQQPGRKPA